MKKSIHGIRGAVVLLAVAAAVIGAAAPARAGSAYILQYHYTWSSNLSIPLLPLGGTVIVPVNAYNNTSVGVEVVGDTGPNGPNIHVETEFVYEGGGPLNGDYDDFQTNVAYWQPVNGTHIIATVMYRGSWINLFTTWWPQVFPPTT